MSPARLPRLPRLLAVASAAAALAVSGIQPAHAVAGGVAVSDPTSDVTITSPTPQKFTRQARSIELLKVSAAGGGTIRFTAATKKPLNAADPGKAHPVGITFLLCEGVPDGGCDGTVVTYTDDGDPRVDIGWQGGGDQETLPEDCAGTAKVGRSIVVSVPRECVRITSGVTVTASILMRYGKPGGKNSALFGDDTDSSDLGDV